MGGGVGGWDGLPAVFLPRYDGRVGRREEDVYRGAEKVACYGCTSNLGKSGGPALYQYGNNNKFIQF